MQQRLSLRAQAVAWLAQREHSELELRRKLQRRLKLLAVQDGSVDDARDGGPDDMAEQVEAVIVWLIERGYLDPQRFIDSRVHVRAGQHGIGRIQHELAQHGLALAPDAVQALRATEFERAQALWQRRFGAAALAPRDAARQTRFLIGRGFSGEVVRRVLRQAAGAAALGPAQLAEPD